MVVGVAEPVLDAVALAVLAADAVAEEDAVDETDDAADDVGVLLADSDAVADCDEVAVEVGLVDITHWSNKFGQTPESASKGTQTPVTSFLHGPRVPPKQSLDGH